VLKLALVGQNVWTFLFIMTKKNFPRILFIPSKLVFSPHHSQQSFFLPPSTAFPASILSDSFFDVNALGHHHVTCLYSYSHSNRVFNVTLM
jgi:hypothetical protein